MKETLARDEIIGRQITALHATDRLLETDLRCTTTYFTLDNGVSFVMPMGFHRFIRSMVPAEAEQLDGIVVDQITSSPIKAVHVVVDETGDASDEIVIELESEACVYDVMVAPAGIPTGVFFISRDRINWSNYCDYWTWHDKRPLPE